MTEPDHSEIYIIKRHGNHEGEHHGGAWKIAFADFMTAMMALFLVLWLISSTSEKTKHTVAQYFNPVKLVDMTTLKKGFRDPKETEMGSGSNVKESLAESPLDKRNPATSASEQNCCSNGDYQAEAVLFRDPYKALESIVAASHGKAIEAEDRRVIAAEKADTQDEFNDPFAMGSRERKTLAEVDDSLVSTADPTNKKKFEQAADSDVPDSALVLKNQQPVKSAPAAGAGEKVPANAGELLSLDIKDALRGTIEKTKAPHVEVQETREGLLISLTDDANYSMFDVGSARPKPETIRVMETIGRVLKGGSGDILIHGHTDGRPYRSATYDNWRLSTERAQMALYMLIRGGLSEKRIESVGGYADHKLKVAGDPNAAENRRIEILLRGERP